VKNTCQVAMVMATAALCAVLLPAPLPGLGQAPAPASAEEKEKALRAKRLAEEFERDAQVLTVFDRQGKVVSTVGGPGLRFTAIRSSRRTGHGWPWVRAI
jgi:hypothetical protein